MSTDEDRNRLLSAEELAAMEDDGYDADEENAAALATLGVGPLDGDDETDKEGDDSGNDGDQGADDQAANDEVAAGTENDKGGKTGADDDQKSEGGEAEKQPEAAGKTDAEPAAKAKDGYSVTVPDDLDTQLADNRKAMHTLRRSLNDGDIDADEYEAKLDELEDKRDGLRDLKNRASIAEEMRQQTLANAWVSAINNFVADAAKTPELGIIDYTKDAAKQAEFDTFLRAIAAQPGNENRESRWLLEEAHKRMVVLHGIATTAKKAGATDRKPDTSKVVNNLADVPGGAGDADPVSNEFAELDKLEGLEYERALSDMKTRFPEKHTRYLQSA